MNEKAVKVISSVKNPLPVGKNYRLLCLTGDNKGKSYLMNEDRVTLGRSVEADVVIFDGKSSKIHAELKKIGKDFFLTDLGSRNGVFVNDLRIKQHSLQDGDRFVIGETVFKYQVIITKEVAKIGLVDDEDEEDEEQAQKDKIAKKKTRRLIVIGLLGFSLMMFLDDGPQERAKKKSRSIEEIINNRFKKTVLSNSEQIDPEVKGQLDSVIHRGQREFREKNYFRAMSEFRHALNLDPENSTASYYLEKTKQELDKEIKNHFTSAKKAIDSIKYESATINYCTVIRLLQDYPEDERYKEAVKSLNHLEKKMEKQKGEIKCF
ncbi:FHA domain-containing protein [bacterium]|nr:FHA domain-containing protein [bacterium]